MQTLFLGKSDDGLLAGSDDEDVRLASGEGLSVGILDVDDVVTSDVSLDVDDLSDPTDIVSAGDEAGVSEVILDPLNDFVLVEVVLEGVTLLDLGMGESDCPAVVGNDVGDLVGSDTAGLNLQQLELSRSRLYVGFAVLNGLKHESALNVVEHSEAFLGLCDLHNIHDSNWESLVTPDLVVDEDSSFLIVEDEGDFTSVHGILETVLDENGQGQRLT